MAKNSGLVQLYQSCGTVHQLYKEWKNSNMNSQDLIVCIGILNNQYLYTCSREGKLVIRDLVNDDANESYKVYLINKPVSEVKLAINGRRILILSAGKNNDLKLYEIDSLNSESTGPFIIHDSSIRLTIRPLGRTFTSLSLSRSGDRQVTVLCPLWSAITEKFVYTALPLESVSQWVSSICQVGSEVVCGTQFGEILIYDLKGGFAPIKTIDFSHFAITHLTPISGGVVFCDSMSSVGIIRNGEVTKRYDGLLIGPTSTMKFMTKGDGPIYLLCTTIVGLLVIYKLLSDGESDLLLNIKMSALGVLDISNDNEYEAIHEVFGYDYEVEGKRGIEGENHLSWLSISKRRRTSESTEEKNESEVKDVSEVKLRCGSRVGVMLHNKAHHEIVGNRKGAEMHHIHRMSDHQITNEVQQQQHIVEHDVASKAK